VQQQTCSPRGFNQLSETAWNFIQKNYIQIILTQFQTVSEKSAKTLEGYFFCTLWVLSEE